MRTISVVIPTYNRGSLIAETLDCVLAQTTPPSEIIVIDDGSTDDTQSVLAHYSHRIQSMVIENSGETYSRNLGMSMAHGDLIAFCDSDDLWMPTFLSELNAQWDFEPKLIACYSNFRTLRDGRLSDGSKFDDAPPGFWQGLRRTGPESGVFDASIIARLLEFQPFFPSCMMVAKSAFTAIGGWDEAVSRIVGCDFATTLRVAALPPIGVVTRPLVAIRKHNSNFSGNTEKMNLGDARVLEYVLRSRAEAEPLRYAFLRSINKRRAKALELAFSRFDFGQVREIYQLLPSGALPSKARLKLAIASLPSPINRLLAALTMQ